MPQKIIGSYTLSNTSALVIYDDLNDETVTSAFLYFDYLPASKRKTKVYTDLEGRSYIRRHRTSYYLDEFMRV